MKSGILFVFFAAVGVIGLGPTNTVAQGPPPSSATPANDRPVTERPADAFPYPHSIPAPGLEGAAGWVNVAEPLELLELRGRFVLLDFWTYCCINCMHVLPELKKLEHAYPEELVVIGIHSAKFEGEEESDNIREAAERYEIEHPIVNDAEMAIWRRYGAQSWPTLVMIDPVGDVIWAANGERKFEDMKAVIDRGLPYYRKHGLLKPAPRPTLLIQGQATKSPLRFPGKVLADEAGGRLFIADSNHNRIVATKLDGRFEFAIGSGEIGRANGDFAACSFNHPQGMALSGDVLYIADTENHLLRKVDLINRKVSTIAGTGERGSGWPEALDDEGSARVSKSPKTTAIASPWALWVHGNKLWIAMAGTHQIWTMALDESAIGPYAGNGREDIVDGPLLPKRPYELGFASFAQPSGLTSDGSRLFVADSEGSAIRAVPFEPGGSVETLVGVTETLFDFGDRDGVGRDVRLQHPLGVAFYGDKLYVADTYNNKIKEIDVAQRSCRTLAGTSEAGADDAADGMKATFNEPGGLSTAGGKLYVADTNNHVIRVVDLAAPHGVTTLRIEGLSPP